MKVTIDNNLRTFFIVTSTGKSAFCQIEHINDVMQWLGTNPGYFKIYHFWNNKQQRLTGKHLREIAAANDVILNFQY